MKKAFIYLLLSLFFLACEQENFIDESKTQLSESEILNLLNDYKVRELLLNQSLTSKEIDVFKSLGFSGHQVRIYQTTNISTNELFKEYEIDGDVYITEKELFSYGEVDLQKQFRTNNLVTNNQTIHIMGVNLNNNPTVREGLTRAVENYNLLNIGLQFTLSFEDILSFADIWKWYSPGIKIAMDYRSGTGGFANFPSSGGAPGRIVKIFQDTESLSYDLNEHILTHEIGHCLGMRHTDFFNRSISCNQGGNEGSAGVGAIHIPGTPNQTNIDMNSVFLSCFSLLETGEFSNFDIIALEGLY